MKNTVSKPKKESKKLADSNFVIYLSIASSFTSIIAFIILIIEKTDSNFNLETLFGGFFTAIWATFLVLLCIYFYKGFVEFYREYNNIGVLALIVLFGGFILFGIIIIGYFVGELIYFLGSSFIRDIII